jgi:opacity protein-like surface antigen
MKTLAIAAVIAAAATSASAFDIGSTGVSIGGTLDANYTTGISEYAVDLTPRAQFSSWGVTFGAESTFDIMGLNEGDVFKGVDLDAAYEIGDTGLTAYGEVGTDGDFNFGDFKMGVSFSF